MPAPPSRVALARHGRPCENARIELENSVAVFGQGPVGLSGTLIAKAMGARVLAVDISGARLDLARTAGADHVINAGDADPAMAIRELTGGKVAPAALET